MQIDPEISTGFGAGNTSTSLTSAYSRTGSRIGGKQQHNSPQQIGRNPYQPSSFSNKQYVKINNHLMKSPPKDDLIKPWSN